LSRRAGDVYVVTVDIRGSRKLANRDKVQSRTRQLLHRLNSLYSEALLAPFEFTLGDEFQGVFRTQSIEAAWDIFKLLKKRLGVPFYYGIGVGGINTPRGLSHLRMRPTEMDGKAFHASRHAVLTAKTMRVEFVIEPESHESFVEVNTLVELMLYVANNWTPMQRRVISILEASPDMKYTMVAKHLGVTKQAISNILSRSGWAEFRDAETLLRALLVRSVGGQPRDVYSVRSTRWG
jgi:hypothetical protein